MAQKKTGDGKHGISPKKQSRKRADSKDSSKASVVPHPPHDRRALEKMTSDLTRLLADQSFDSVDDANAFIQQYVGQQAIPLPERELTPLERAQDKMYQAWEARTPKLRVKLAREALRISPDSADAYVLLAEETARTTEAALKLYEAGVQAGERALGYEIFVKEVGNFWGIFETRPYMRARAGVAECLWEMGETEQAISHYKELLRLNPNDNQGNRYPLLELLLEENRDIELGELLAAYKDESSADWAYTTALWRFRQEGKSGAARRALREAFDINDFVPLYLLGERELPMEMPEYISPGEESEATDYVLRYGRFWLESAPAIEWFIEVFAQLRDEMQRLVRQKENARKLKFLMGH